ncbi:MAG: hypothetical protein KatS3mg023_0075 [Armatimonadota bacterium]|nr:MAG: hypothetical protein KatS3mg023_0075 [Armatimonadota bacterium]
MRLWLRCVAFCALSMITTFSLASSPLEDDSRLQLPINLRAKMLPIPQILREIGKQTEVPLECTKSISEDKMTVLVRDCPAWKVLQKMAEVMGYSWQQTKTGYRLTQSARSAQEEAQALLEEQSALREEVQQFIREAELIAQRDYPEIVREYVQLDKEIGSLWARSQEVPEDLSRRRNLLHNVAQPQRYLFARVCQRFSPQDWRRFWNGEVLIASTIRGEQWLPITENIPSWREAREELSNHILSQWAYPGGTPVLREGQRYTLPEVSPSTQYLFAFYLDWEAGRIRTNLMQSEDGRSYASDQMDVFWSEMKRKEAHLGALWRRWEEWQTPKEARKDSPLCREPIQRQGGEKDNRTTPSPFVDNRKTMADYLGWLFDHAQVHIVADAFRYPVGGGQMCADAEDKTVGDWIDRLTKDADSAYLFGWWRIDDDFLMFRHHRYWWLRQSEPAESLLKTLEERTAKRSISLDDYARLARSMTPAQEGRLKCDLLVVRFDKAPFGEILQSNLPALRFWASLTPVQQHNLLSGKPLHVDTLPLALQQLFWQAVGYGLVHASEITSLSEPALLFPQLSASFTQRERYRFVGQGWTDETDSIEQFWNEHFPLRMAITGSFTPPTAITKFLSADYQMHFVFSPTNVVRYFIRLRIPEEVGDRL